MNTSVTFKSNYEQVRQLKVAGNAKAVFSELRTVGSQFNHLAKGYDVIEWSENAEIILEEVAKNGSGFKKEIALKAMKYKRMTEKQAWCVAFDFIAISKLSF